MEYRFFSNSVFYPQFPVYCQMQPVVQTNTRTKLVDFLALFAHPTHTKRIRVKPFSLGCLLCISQLDWKEIEPVICANVILASIDIHKLTQLTCHVPVSQHWRNAKCTSSCDKVVCKQRSIIRLA